MQDCVQTWYFEYYVDHPVETIPDNKDALISLSLTRSQSLDLRIS